MRTSHAYAATRSIAHRFLVTLAALAGVFHGIGSHAGTPTAADADIRQAILDCTFELVSAMRENAADAPTVRVAGTAFCFGDGQLASAAHVFDQVLGGRFDAPVLRDRHGRVYPIDHIVRYSMQDDFVVFTATGLPGLPARPHNTTDAPGDTLYLAWRRGESDIAFGRARYRGRSTVATLGRGGWIRFAPAPDHGASGAALFDASGHVVGLVNGRMSEREDAEAFAVPIRNVSEASTEWADIAMRDPLRPLGMASERNMPLIGGIPLPSPYARFEKHMAEVRRTYFAHTLPYSLALVGEDAPLSDERRASLCAALQDRYCLDENDPAVTLARSAWTSRGCEVTWHGLGAALVRCSTRAGLTGARLIEDTRAQLATAALGRRFAQAPPAPCTDSDPLTEIAANESFTDHTGAAWQLHAWPVRGCDWVIVSMARALPDGTLTFVRGATSANAEAAAMQLKAMTAIRCQNCNRSSSPSVFAGLREVQNEIAR